ncbi:hypothetical protein PPBDW_II1272 [Photobacterium kishitanii]|nr:hypothetical protein PPBDW_II1272 [Photobacterium kishitanii]
MHLMLIDTSNVQTQNSTSLYGILHQLLLVHNRQKGETP